MEDKRFAQTHSGHMHYTLHNSDHTTSDALEYAHIFGTPWHMLRATTVQFFIGLSVGEKEDKCLAQTHSGHMHHI